MGMSITVAQPAASAATCSPTYMSLILQSFLCRVYARSLFVASVCHHRLLCQVLGLLLLSCSFGSADVGGASWLVS